MKAECQVLTTPTSDSPGTCLLLHFDSKRYLIGHIGEGAQRAFAERGARLAKTTDIFLSGRTEWKNTGGLVGVLLTMGDVEEGKALDNAVIAAKKGKKAPERKGITVHGGENLMHILATTRPFVFRKAMKLKINEIPKQVTAGEDARATPYFKDDNMVLRPMHIYPEGYQPAEPMQFDSPGGEKAPASESTTKKRAFNVISDSGQTREAILRGVVEDMFCSNWTMDTMIEDGPPLNENDMMMDPPKRPRSEERDSQLSTRPPPPGKTRAPWPASAVRNLPRSTPSPVAMSYIITLRPVRGRFLPKKAIALGIKPGPDFARVVAGEILTLANGNVVKPEDVMEATRPGTGFAVCDIPETTYIADFLAQQEWKDAERVQIEIGCFFWILGEGVAADERIQTFIKAMPHARHIVSSVDVCPNTITFKGAATAATKLNLMDPTYFPLPHANNTVPIYSLAGIEPAQSGLIWQIEPKWELQDSKVVPQFSVEKVLEGIEPEYARLAKEVREQNEQMMPTESSDGGWSDIEVIMLGTGSAAPSRYRNVSATLLRVPGAGSVLFDCGENTLGQLKRLYEPAELREVLRDLKAVYISHLHADHHLGTVAVLKAWYEEVHLKNITTTAEDTTEDRTNNERVMDIVAPRRFSVWLQEYADVEQYGFSKIRFTCCEDIRSRSQVANISHLPDVLNALSLEDIQVSAAFHCQSSFTTAWTWTNGFKFAYSGDTRPTRGFVEIGRGATILLHEATFDDELIGEAVAKRHSTTSEALRAGRDMGARGVVLTHFSQRYPKLPVLSEAVEEGMEVVLAFDLCRVRVGDLERFGGFLDGLRELYKDEEVEDLIEEEDDEVAKEEARKLAVKQKQQQRDKAKQGKKVKQAKQKEAKEIEVKGVEVKEVEFKEVEVKEVEVKEVDAKGGQV